MVLNDMITLKNDVYTICVNTTELYENSGDGPLNYRTRARFDEWQKQKVGSFKFFNRKASPEMELVENTLPSEPNIFLLDDRLLLFSEKVDKHSRKHTEKQLIGRSSCRFEISMIVNNRREKANYFGGYPSFHTEISSDWINFHQSTFSICKGTRITWDSIPKVLTSGIRVDGIEDFKALRTRPYPLDVIVPEVLVFNLEQLPDFFGFDNKVYLREGFLTKMEASGFCGIERTTTSCKCSITG